MSNAKIYIKSILLPLIVGAVVRIFNNTIGRLQQFTKAIFVAARNFIPNSMDHIICINGNILCNTKKQRFGR